MFRAITVAASAVAILATPLAAAAQQYDNQNYGDHRDDRERDHRDDRDRADGDRRDGDRGYGGRDFTDRRDGDRHDGDRRDGDRRAYAGGGAGDWRRYRNYDYSHPAPGQRAYYADQYYRDGRYYQTRRLGPNDRIYRGRDNRYYCRRSDGTTGLVIGAIGGGVLGNVIAGGGSRTLGTLLGAAGGGLLGRSIDRDNVQCR